MDVDIVAALRESEERYRTLFEQAPVGVFLYDRSLRLTECNRCFVSILRSSYDKLIGLDLQGLRDLSVLPAIERAIEGEPGFYEGRYEATTSGAAVYIAMRTSPLRDGEGNVVAGLGLVEDVTERMRALDLLRASEERLKLHVAHSPLAAIVLDVEGRVVEWNEAATRIFGWSAEEMRGQSVMERIVPEPIRPQIEALARRLITNTGGARSTNENVTRDGRTILCDWYNTALVSSTGEVYGIASLVADVSERREAEEALRRSESRFRELIEHMPEAIAVSRDGNFVWVNAALLRYLGYTADALMGRALAEITHVDDRPVLEERGRRIARGEAPGPVEYRLIRRDGTVVVAEVDSVRIQFDGVPSSVAVVRDVTERKQMQLRLLQADRMASVGTLAAGVAHEINNPLAYLMANLDVVAGRRLPALIRQVRALEERSGGVGAVGTALADELGQAIEMLDIAREGAGRVRDIVRDLKTFSRTDDERRGPVDVRRVLDASINMAWNEIRHRARLLKDYAEVPPVHANESRLGQVFLNLLVNAAQALQVGSATEHEIRVRVYLDAAGRVSVDVGDSGPGIAPEILARIFDPFFTTKPVGVGTGLGLWICQGIVTALGGDLAVRSEPGQGATFTVSLNPHDYLAAPRERSVPVPDDGPRGRLLIVDDELAVARALRDALGDEHEVTVTLSGREALEMLRRDPAFDVVLCDLMMPDVGGIELLQALEAERSPAVERLMFMTGGAFTPQARDLLDRFPEPPIDKPFDVDALRARIGRKLRRVRGV